MAHDINTADLSPEELKYKDTVARGDDYDRIELYRWALHYYKLASGMHFHDNTLQSKIAAVNEKIRKETRIILGVLLAAVIVILTVWLLW